MAAVVTNNPVREDLQFGHYRLGVFVGIASVVMLFTGLTSAYIVRAASAPDWITLPLPRVLWIGTSLIIISSISLETARSRLRQPAHAAYRIWLTLTAFLGMGFLAAQFSGWRQLIAEGVYIASHPHSSFFYLLTAAHGFHLAGGLLALLYLLLRYRKQPEDRVAFAKRVAVTDAVTIYWHFMAALWIFLFFLLFRWR